MSLQWHRRLVSPVALALISVTLTGCEEPHEKALRLSCHWNVDLQLKGCPRLGFKNCIDSCEYCVGAEGTPLQGRSDECAQLKCGAYCAKRFSEECLTTYKTLCQDGKALVNEQGGDCNVDCSSAPSRLPRTLGVPMWLIATLFGFSGTTLHTSSRSGILIAAAGFVAFHLQGCSPCEPSSPTLSWQADFQEMDRRAGCLDDFNLMWGNPCASDVPVVMAKKGFIEQSDGDYRRGNVENEAYECTERGPGGYCMRWTSFESSCGEEDFGICTCQEPGPEGWYCQRWQCVSKEAEQNICWKDCCGKQCDPCVACGEQGSSPFPMNEDVFRQLLASDGTSFILTIASSNTSDDRVLAALRHTHWSNFNHVGECIMPRDIKSVFETPCENWREIETEVSNCFCTSPHEGGKFCQKWRCEEKDVGLFSILFARSRSYASLLSGLEEEEYTCLDSVRNGLQERCTRWKGLISSYEEVETTQCEVKCPMQGDLWCNRWVCNEYELPRVHSVDQWWKRLLFVVAHFLWLLPTMGVSSVPFWFHDRVPMTVSCEIFLCLILVVILWSVGFVRYHSHEGRWERPAIALAGFLVTFFVPYLLGTGIAMSLQRKWENTHPMPIALALFSFALAGSTWATGLVGALILILPPMACFLCCWCRSVYKLFPEVLDDSAS